MFEPKNFCCDPDGGANLNSSFTHPFGFIVIHFLPLLSIHIDFYSVRFNMHFKVMSWTWLIQVGCAKEWLQVQNERIYKWGRKKCECRSERPTLWDTSLPVRLFIHRCVSASLLKSLTRWRREYWEPRSPKRTSYDKWLEDFWPILLKHRE